MKTLSKIVEISSNIAIVMIAVLLGYFIINRSLMSPEISASKPITQAGVAKPGAKLEMSVIDWSKSERNLLIVLSTKCHFCSESMSFYQRLIERNAQDKSLRIIAALPQEVDEATKYLSEHKVMVDEVVKADPGEATVRGTPTILLVNKDGVVLQTWVGKLPLEKENEVLARAFSPVAGL